MTHRSAHESEPRTARQGPEAPSPARDAETDLTQTGASRLRVETPDGLERGARRPRRRSPEGRGRDEKRRWLQSGPPTSDSRYVRRPMSRMMAGSFLIGHPAAWFDSFPQFASAAEEVWMEGGHWPWSAGAGLCLDLFLLTPASQFHISIFPKI